MRGGHYLKGWSKTQQCVTLSSAEAELVAMNRAAAELFGVPSMYADLGEQRRAADGVNSGPVPDSGDSNYLLEPSWGGLWR